MLLLIICILIFCSQNQLVQEKQDNCWTLPGGWADINESASKSIVREFAEETGISVKTVKIIALLDKLKQAHPPQLPHAYKCIFLCERIAKNADPPSNFKSIEIADMGYFSLDKLPPLSVNRVTSTQIDLCFQHYLDVAKATANSLTNSTNYCSSIPFGNIFFVSSKLCGDS